MRKSYCLQLCKTLSFHPCRAFGAMVFVMIVPIILIAVSIPTLSLNPASPPDPFDERTINQDLIALARLWSSDQLELSFQINLDEEEEEEETAELQSSPAPIIMFVYRAPDGNVLTAKNIQRMREIENLFTENKDLDLYCLKMRGSCTFPVFRSLTLYFYAENVNGTYIPNGQAEKMRDFDEVLVELAQPTFFEAEGAYYLDATFDPPNSLKTEVTRSMLMFGMPLKGFTSLDDRAVEQSEIFGSWAVGIEEQMKLVTEPYATQLEVLYFGTGPTGLLTAIFNSLILRDGIFAAFSIFWIFGYIFYHSSSVFLAFAGSLHILLSFPLAYGFYYLVWGIEDFFFLNILGIYVILAIGADDIFVYVDAWKHSYHEFPGREGFHGKGQDTVPLAERALWVYKRAAKAMFITSFTTTVAFLATAVSPLPLVAAFGIFSAWLVVCNYFFVVTYFPMVMIVYYHCFEHLPCCCCAPCHVAKNRTHGQEELQLEERGSETNVEEASGHGSVKADADDSVKPDADDSVKADADDSVKADGADADNGEKEKAKRDHPELYLETPEEEAQMECVQRCLVRCFDHVAVKPWVLNITMVLFLIWFIITLYFAGQLGPATRTDQFLPETHPLQKFVDYQTKFRVSTDDDNVIVTTIWGVSHLDKTGVTKFDVAETARGELVWTPDFDMTTPFAQEFFVEECRLLKTDAKLVRSEEITCPLEAFKEWVESPESYFQRWLLDVNSTTPQTGDWPILDPTDFNDLLAWWFMPGFLPFTTFQGMLGFHGHFPILTPAVFGNATELMQLQFGVGALAAQLNNPNLTASNRSEIETQLAYLEPQIAPKTAAVAKQVDVIRDASTIEWQYMIVSANSTLKEERLPAAKIEPTYERWENYVAAANHRAKTAKLGIECHQAAAKWAESKQQSVYISSALSGAGISLALAFVVLLVSTGNLLIAIYALATLLGIMACLLGFMVALGWQLGIIESICATVLVGLSVDYVVHLANAYVECNEQSRLARSRHMIKDMAHTVFGGAITSVGASLILFGCQVQLFFKFGWFMCLTCFLSIVWSLCFFTSVCIRFGPEGNFLQIPWAKMFAKCPGGNQQGQVEKDSESVSVSNRVEVDEAK